MGPGGTGATYTDSGNLNWDKGDRFSTPVKAVVDFSIRQADMGILLAFMFLVNVFGAILLLPALAAFLVGDKAGKAK